MASITEETYNTVNTLNSYIKKHVCGTNHNVVLMNDGTLHAMGNNSFYQLGNITTGTLYNKVILDYDKGSDPKKWIDVATNYDTTFAITEDGLIYYWGKKFNNITNADVSSPTQLFFSSTLKATKIACGLKHLLVLDANRNVYGFGDNTLSQIKGGVNTKINEPNSNFYLISAIQNKYDNIYCNSNYSVISNNNGLTYITGTFTSSNSINLLINNGLKVLKEIDGSQTLLNSISCGPTSYIYTTFTINAANVKSINNFVKITGINIDTIIIAYTPTYIYASTENTFIADNNKNLYVNGKYNNMSYSSFFELKQNITDINIVSNINYTIQLYDKTLNIFSTNTITNNLLQGFNRMFNKYLANSSEVGADVQTPAVSAVVQTPATMVLQTPATMVLQTPATMVLQTPATESNNQNSDIYIIVIIIIIILLISAIVIKKYVLINDMY